MPSKNKTLVSKKKVAVKSKDPISKVAKKDNKNYFIKGIQKRDGEIVPFNIEKISCLANLFLSVLVAVRGVWNVTKRVHN